MRQVGEQTEPVARFESSQHVHCTRDRGGVIDKSRKVRLNSEYNPRILGFELVSQLLQGSADPESIVRLLALCMGRLTESPGCGAVEGDKSLMGDGKAVGLQAMQQPTHGLFAGDEVMHRNQGLEQVKTNGLDVLHDDVLLHSADA